MKNLLVLAVVLLAGGLMAQTPHPTFVAGHFENLEGTQGIWTAQKKRFGVMTQNMVGDPDEVTTNFNGTYGNSHWLIVVGVETPWPAYPEWRMVWLEARFEPQWEGHEPRDAWFRTITLWGDGTMLVNSPELNIDVPAELIKDITKSGGGSSSDGGCVVGPGGPWAVLLMATALWAHRRRQ